VVFVLIAAGCTAPEKLSPDSYRAKGTGDMLKDAASPVVICTDNGDWHNCIPIREWDQAGERWLIAGWSGGGDARVMLAREKEFGEPATPHWVSVATTGIAMWDYVDPWEDRRGEVKRAIHKVARERDVDGAVKRLVGVVDKFDQRVSAEKLKDSNARIDAKVLDECATKWWQRAR